MASGGMPGNGHCPSPTEPVVVPPSEVQKLCELVELLGGEPTDPAEKITTTQTEWTRKSDCALLVQILCMQGEDIISETWIDPAIPETIGKPDMSEVEFAGAGFTPVPKTLEAEVEHFALEGEFSGTIAELAALAGFPVYSDEAAGIKLETNLAMLCGYKVKAAPCDSKVLTDPLDPTTVTDVIAEGTFVNGVQIAGDADLPFATVDSTAPVAQVADALSIWCFQYCIEGTCDKAGVFTATAASGKE